MKPLKAAVAMLLVLLLFSCNTGAKDAEKASKDYALLYVLMLWNWSHPPNSCPSYTLLNPGNTTVNLSQGGQFWFDISPRIGVENYKNYYNIVLQKSPGQTVDLGDTRCYGDGIPHSYSSYSDPNQTITQIGDTITYHVHVSNSSLAGQKLLILTSTVGSGNITITVPSVGTAN